ncbi:5'-nucleotidase [Papilio xuthus]|nr:5'-nucleotidase [Papilio xuthus]
MLQVAGMRVVYNASSEVGSRVVSAHIRCIECDIPRYLPLDVNKTYRVLTQSYIGDGGGGYTMLSENRENVENLDVDYVMLQRHMRKQRNVIQDHDGRIQVVF